MISFSTFLLTSPFIKPILGVGNLKDLKTLRYTLFDIDKCWISSVSTSKMKTFCQRVLFRNALKSLKYENGSNFLKNQFFTKCGDRLYVHDRSMINWKFWQKFWRLPIFFFSKRKIANSVHETSYNDFSFRDIKVW